MLSDTQRNYGSKSVANDVGARAWRTLDRIAMAQVGASRDTLTVAREAPENDSEINSEINSATSLALAEGVPTRSNPQRSVLTSDGAPSIAWVENPGDTHETRVIWSRDVRAFAAGEVPNGIDGNGNGLIDEKGLSFAIEGNTVIVSLTLERPGRRGRARVGGHDREELPSRSARLACIDRSRAVALGPDPEPEHELALSRSSPSNLAPIGEAWIPPRP